MSTLYLNRKLGVKGGNMLDHLSWTECRKFSKVLLKKEETERERGKRE